MQNRRFNLDSGIGTQIFQQLAVFANLALDHVQISLMKAFNHTLNAGLAFFQEMMILILLTGLKQRDLVDQPRS